MHSNYSGTPLTDNKKALFVTLMDHILLWPRSARLDSILILILQLDFDFDSDSLT